MLSSSNLGPRPVAPCLPFSWFSFSPMPLASVATHLQVISPLYLQLSPPLGSRSIRSIDPSIQLLINVSWKFSRHLKCSILTPNSQFIVKPCQLHPHAETLPPPPWSRLLPRTLKFFKTPLLRYDLYTIKRIHHKRAMHYFLVNVYICATITTVQFENISITKITPPGQFVVNSNPTLCTRQPQICFLAL